MRRLCLVALFACSSPSADMPPQPAEIRSIVLVAPADANAVHNDTPADAAVAPKVVVPERLWSGRHALSISAVELSADATVAVTLDERGHARLWPALDGTREPLVLPIAAPSQIAVHHDADGIAIAALDAAGGIEVLAIDQRDELHTDTKLDSEPPYAIVIATDEGFIAVRADHYLDLVDKTGTRRAQLVPGHGERVARLLNAGGRTLALLETTAGVHGRWIVGGNDSLAWGEETPVLDLDARTVSISPDATRLAGMRSKRRGAVYVEIATGAARPIELDGNLVPTGKLLGFVSNNAVVFNDMDNSGEFLWYDLSKKTTTTLNDGISFGFEANVTAVRGGKLVSGFLQELVIITKSKLTYLGYRRDSARQLRTSPAGPIANLGGAALLDDHFRIDRRIPNDAVMIDRDLALIQIGVAPQIDESWLEVKPPHRHKVTRVALYDLANKRELQHWPIAQTARRVRYEPATRLMVIDHGSKLEVAHFDPIAREFGPSTTIKLRGTTDLALVDPALADGVVAITVHGRELRRWRLEDLDRGALPDATAVDAGLEAIDRAGRLYLRAGPDTVVVRAGEHEIRIDELKGWSLRPSPDATRIAAFAKSRVMLLDAAGALLWSIGLPGVADLAWTADGRLVAQGGDLVELATADGHIAYAQCGWSFGARTQMRDAFDIPATVCDR